MWHKISSADKIMKGNCTSMIVLLVVVIVMVIVLNIFNIAFMLEDEEFVNTLL